MSAYPTVAALISMQVDAVQHTIVVCALESSSFQLKASITCFQTTGQIIYYGLIILKTIVISRALPFEVYGPCKLCGPCVTTSTLTWDQAARFSFLAYNYGIRPSMG